MDVLPKLLIELRDDTDVAAIVDRRVRGFEPAPGDADFEIDAASEHKFKHAFVVLVQLEALRILRVPVQRPRIVARCYGRTHAEAAALRWACSKAIHLVGPRVHNNGLGIYLSKDDGGGEQEKDPDTQQPLQLLLIDLFATTQAVT